MLHSCTHCWKATTTTTTTMLHRRHSHCRLHHHTYTVQVTFACCMMISNGARDGPGRRDLQFVLVVIFKAHADVANDSLCAPFVHHHCDLRCGWLLWPTSPATLLALTIWWVPSATCAAGGGLPAMFPTTLHACTSW